METKQEVAEEDLKHISGASLLDLYNGLVANSTLEKGPHSETLKIVGAEILWRLKRHFYSFSGYQLRVTAWLRRALGEETLRDKNERAFRFLEEALELVQAVGLSKVETQRVVDWVYSRPVGETAQEVSGVLITLLGLSAACDVVAEDALLAELVRIQDPSVIARVQRRQVEKRRICAGLPPEGEDLGATNPSKVAGADQEPEVES